MQRFDPRIYLFAGGHFATDWAQSAIPALLPYFISVCNLSYQDAGTLIFGNILLASICQPILGYYADKVSKPWLAPIGPVISGLSIAIMPFTTNFWVIFLCSMFSGFGSALYHPEAARMVNGLAGEQKGKALGTFSVGGNAGFAIGPMFAGFCAYIFDVHGLVLFGILNSLLALVLYHQLPGIQSDIRHEQIAEAKAHPDRVRKNDSPAFGKLTFVILGRSVGFSICNAFIPLYWINVLHTSPEQGSFALTVLFTMGAFITYFGGIISDRLGFVRVIRIAFALMVPAMFLLTNSTNYMLSMLSLVPVAITLFAPYSSIVVLGQTYLGKNIAFASGITLGLAVTAGGLFSPLVGRAADIWGLPTALQSLWIIAIIAALASFTLPQPQNMPAKKN